MAGLLHHVRQSLGYVCTGEGMTSYRHVWSRQLPLVEGNSLGQVSSACLAANTAAGNGGTCQIQGAGQSSSSLHDRGLLRRDAHWVITTLYRLQSPLTVLSSLKSTDLLQGPWDGEELPLS